MALDALIIPHATSPAGGPSRASAIVGYIGGTLKPTGVVLGRHRRPVGGQLAAS
jgi:hypothetical protein